MDFRLKVFVTAAELLNFSRTAETLGISQPAVSKHIKTLEDEYKVKLFSRLGSKYSLTYSGEILLDKAKKIMTLYKEMAQEGSLLSTVKEGSFTIGIPRALYYGIFPDFAADWCRLSPNSSISHKTLDLKHIEKAVQNSEVSIGIKAGGKEEDLDYFFTDTLMSVSPSSGRENKYLDIAETRLLLYEGDPETSAEITAKLSASGVNPDTMQVAATMKDPASAIKFLVEYGRGTSSTAPPLVSFLWKSQVNELLTKGILETVSLTELEDTPPVRRHYSVCRNQENTLPTFASFARGWAKKKSLL
ncbi:MAG: LysR family transcriptional regulator [Bacteroidales bacterium]|nr:LysR family transcriptional regulator [Bacteroidales bacterium]